jgi:hypothetical protein
MNLPPIGLLSIYIIYLSELFPLVIACVNYKHIKGYLFPLFVFFILSVAIEFSGYMLLKLKYDINLLFYGYTLIEFTTISLFYAMFFKTYFNSKLINYFTLFFIATSLICYRTNLTRADNITMIVEFIVLTGYSLFLFYYILKHLIYVDLLREPVFWINAAVLFYFSGDLVLFVFKDYIVNHYSERYDLFWSITHTFFNVLMNVFFSLGFWKIRRK